MLYFLKDNTIEKIDASVIHSVFFLKRRLCIENRIFLIEFPCSIDKYVKDNIKIQDYIVQELKSKTSIKEPSNLHLYNYNTPEFFQYRLVHYL